VGEGRRGGDGGDAGDPLLSNPLFPPPQTPIHYSNVRLVDPVTKSPVRVAWRFLEDGTKVRVTRGARASGAVVPRPAVLAQRRTPAPLAGAKDTDAGVAAAVTHVPGALPSALRVGLPLKRPPRGFAGSAVS